MTGLCQFEACTPHRRTNIYAVSPSAASALSVEYRVNKVRDWSPLGFTEAYITVPIVAIDVGAKKVAVAVIHHPWPQDIAHEALDFWAKVISPEYLMSMLRHIMVEVRDEYGNAIDDGIFRIAGGNEAFQSTFVDRALSAFLDRAQ